MTTRPARITTVATKNTPVKLEHLIYLIYTSNFSNLIIRHVACGERGIRCKARADAKEENSDLFTDVEER